MNLPRVAVLGDCGVDIYARVKKLPSRDDKVPGDYLGSYGGGVAANFACAAAKLGAAIQLLSSVGADSLGEKALRELVSFGVDASTVHVSQTEATHFCFVALDDSGEKALTIVRTATFFPTWDQLDQAALLNCDHLHIAPFDLQVATRAAERATKAGATVSVDLEPGMLTPGGLDEVAPLLHYTNLLLPNLACIRSLFGNLDVKEAADQLLAFGPQAIAVTLGSRGALVVAEHETVRAEAFSVVVKDTTGAGDCYGAAFVYSWLTGNTLENCAFLANAAGALATTAVGGRGLLPTLGGIQELASSRTSAAQL